LLLVLKVSRWWGCDVYGRKLVGAFVYCAHVLGPKEHKRMSHVVGRGLIWLRLESYGLLSKMRLTCGELKCQ
jgi:hypothetical protein